MLLMFYCTLYSCLILKKKPNHAKEKTTIKKPRQMLVGEMLQKGAGKIRQTLTIQSGHVSYRIVKTPARLPGGL